MKNKKSKKLKLDKRFGHYSFAIGVLIAVILGLAGSVGFSDTTKQGLFSLLVLLGIVIGLLNITGKETKEFVLSAGVLVIISLLALNLKVFHDVLYVGSVLVDLLRAIISFTFPAVIIVSVKNIWRLAKT